MQAFRYIDGTVTLRLDRQDCIGCGRCSLVCPHRILRLEGNRAVIVDRDRCMECGACQTNCPTRAITVSPGVGCAAHIISQWLNTLLGRQVFKGCCE
ncbi:mercury methylation ferredoxin HgcB [Desulfogranum mediterraneum]|uniref:mercury methylation ferredoxin HgcB n=1 Tax=Desulfogranum mediterraneum TaxID=160661 RepID=UPI0004167BD8|nr:mercury methylation ferredoxin HgcB [Desulfogranum mediterraneum]